MSLQVGGARRNSPSVRHIAKCQNPHCGNPNLTRLVDYVKCNVCGWDTRMNAQDVIDKWGSKIDVGAVRLRPVTLSLRRLLRRKCLPTWMQRAAAIVCRSGRGSG